MIGDSIMVKVLGTRGGQVKIGVEAPKDVQVHRQEIYERIVAEQVGPSREAEGSG